MQKTHLADAEGVITNDNALKLKEILNFLKSKDVDQIFLYPVDWVGLNIPDYPIIIKKPMDLTTISQNLENKKYGIVNDVLNDIQLIWDNCRLYNKEGSVNYFI